jgi:hypothetical protein
MDIQKAVDELERGSINRLVDKLCSKAKNEGLQKGIDEINNLSMVVLSTVSKEWIIEELRRRADRLIRQKIWIE